jgi:hypothetical protein
MEIIIISLLVALLFFLLWDRTERFTPNITKSINVKQCDFNDKNLNKRCKEIRDGCSKLKVEADVLKKNLAAGCELKKEGKTVRETLSSRRECVNDVERLIRTKYAKEELCSQIKNMPNKSKNDTMYDLSLSEKMAGFDRRGAFSDVKF